MPRTPPSPPHRHGERNRPAVLLVNLGTPDAPTPQALRRYLRQFLSDPRVVEIPRAVWLPILHGAILPFRPRESAKRYAAVWTAEGSPLRVHTQRQATLLRGYLGDRLRIPMEVAWAMRYGAPSIESVVDSLLAGGCDRIAVVPMYPQYSASTTGSVMDVLYGALSGLRNPPAVRVVKHFHDDPGYIGALAQSVRDDWMRTGRPDKLVMSFHGVPRRTLDLGDPYHCECVKTGRLLAEALGLGADAFHITFQSRFGRAEWLKPYTADVLESLGAARTGRVDVICPGFVADCLETLEEIAIEGRDIFRAAGGGELHYIPCLNERDDWIKALTDIAATETTGWTHAPSDEDLAASRARALALGAPS